MDFPICLMLVWLLISITIVQILLALLRTNYKLQWNVIIKLMLEGWFWAMQVLLSLEVENPEQKSLSKRGMESDFLSGSMFSKTMGNSGKSSTQGWWKNELKQNSHIHKHDTFVGKSNHWQSSNPALLRHKNQSSCSEKRQRDLTSCRPGSLLSNLCSQILEHSWCFMFDHRNQAVEATWPELKVSIYKLCLWVTNSTS